MCSTCSRSYLRGSEPSPSHPQASENKNPAVFQNPQRMVSGCLDGWFASFQDQQGHRTSIRTKLIISFDDELTKDEIETIIYQFSNDEPVDWCTKSPYYIKGVKPIRATFPLDENIQFQEDDFSLYSETESDDDDFKEPESI